MVSATKLSVIKATYQECLDKGMDSLRAINYIMLAHYNFYFKHPVKHILAYGNDYKTVKGEKMGVYTGILYLASHNNVVSNYTVCPNAELAGCADACLYTAGRGRYQKVQAGRMRKTLVYILDKDMFFMLLGEDMRRGANRATSLGYDFAVRLNGTSDIDWGSTPAKKLAKKYKAYMYDYTKIVERALKHPKGYHLTVSYSQHNAAYQAKIERAMQQDTKLNVAVVFRKELPDTFLGRKVINGDESDVRFKDKRGVIVGLKAKGKARQDYSGFVVDI